MDSGRQLCQPALLADCPEATRPALPCGPNIPEPMAAQPGTALKPGPKVVHLLGPKPPASARAKEASA